MDHFPIVLIVLIWCTLCWEIAWLVAKALAESREDGSRMLFYVLCFWVLCIFGIAKAILMI